MCYVMLFVCFVCLFGDGRGFVFFIYIIVFREYLKNTKKIDIRKGCYYYDMIVYILCYFAAGGCGAFFCCKAAILANLASSSSFAFFSSKTFCF